MAPKKDFRREFISDAETERILTKYAGNNSVKKSRILREAARLYDTQEEMFDAIEADPGFIAMMKESEKAIREGRYITHEEMKRLTRGAQKEKARTARGG